MHRAVAVTAGGDRRPCGSRFGARRLPQAILKLMEIPMSYSNSSDAQAKAEEGSQLRPSLRTLWEQGHTAVGVWCAIPSALSAEAMARSGFDWVCIDMQHGCMDYPIALEMIRAIDATPCQSIVRVPIK
jgi:4-hydroxy-2-oxoheptanedioate aldolase